LSPVALPVFGSRPGPPPPEFSDFLDVTEAAVARGLAGGNPYGIGYAVTIPPGSPFPYGPVALLWYAPFGSATQSVELANGIAILMVLVLRGRHVRGAGDALDPL